MGRTPPDPTDVVIKKSKTFAGFRFELSLQTTSFFTGLQQCG